MDESSPGKTKQGVIISMYPEVSPNSPCERKAVCVCVCVGSVAIYSI